MGKADASGGEGANAQRERFFRLLAPHQASLLRYARRALDAPGDVEDVLQTATLLAFRDFARFVERTNFRAFAFTYLVHEVQNANRRRRPATLGLEPPEPAEEPADIVEALASERAYDDLIEIASPELILGSIDEPLARALRALPELERDAFLLRSIGDLKYAEIATVRGIPLGTVMVRLHRARAKLRRALTDYATEKGFVGRDPGKAPS